MSSLKFSNSELSSFLGQFALYLVSLLRWSNMSLSWCVYACICVCVCVRAWVRVCNDSMQFSAGYSPRQIDTSLKWYWSLHVNKYAYDISIRPVSSTIGQKRVLRTTSGYVQSRVLLSQFRCWKSTFTHYSTSLKSKAKLHIVYFSLPWAHSNTKTLHI